MLVEGGGVYLGLKGLKGEEEGFDWAESWGEAEGEGEGVKDGEAAGAVVGEGAGVTGALAKVVELMRGEGAVTEEGPVDAGGIGEGGGGREGGGGWSVEAELFERGWNVRRGVEGSWVLRGRG